MKHSKDKVEHVRLDEITVDECFAPPIDQLFVEKYIRFKEGSLPAYVCKIPIVYVKPLSLTYYPEEWPPFLPFIETCKNKIKEKDYPVIWVYQQGRFFVMSDDYPAYYAYIELEHPFIVARCLGKPEHPAIRQLHGPTYANKGRSNCDRTSKL